MNSDSNKYVSEEIEMRRATFRSTPAKNENLRDMVYESLILPMNNILNGVEVDKNINILNRVPVLMRFRSIEERVDHFDYPFLEFFHFFKNIDDSQTLGKCIGIFAFLVSTKFFPFDEFISENNGENIAYMVNVVRLTNNKNVFAQAVLALKYLLKRSLVLRNTLFDNGLLEILANSCFYEHCVKIGSFIKSMIEMGELSHEYIQDFLTLIKRLITSKNSQTLKNILDATQDIIEQSHENLDIGFIYENMDRLISNEDTLVLSSLIYLLKDLPNIPINYADVFLRKLMRYNELIGPTMKLYQSKVNEWFGFVNDELIEVMINFLDLVDYQDELEIFRTLLLYFPFNSVFDKRMIKELLKFTTNPDFTQQCLNHLFEIMRSDLTLENKMDLCDMLEQELVDFDMFLNDCDEETRMIGEIFLQEYTKMKEEIK